MSPIKHDMKVWSKRSIKQGEEITIQYLPFMYGHLKRKKQIKSSWFFDCLCPRCQDSTELGLHFSVNIQKYIFIYCPEIIDQNSKVTHIGDNIS